MDGLLWKKKRRIISVGDATAGLVPGLPLYIRNERRRRQRRRRWDALRSREAFRRWFVCFPSSPPFSFFFCYPLFQQDRGPVVLSCSVLTERERILFKLSRRKDEYESAACHSCCGNLPEFVVSVAVVFAIGFNYSSNRFLILFGVGEWRGLQPRFKRKR